MVGLGILNDIPPNSIQPELVDGIHLRWAFKRDLDFPWYGYYLFRRKHREGNLISLQQMMSSYQPGDLPDNVLNLMGHQIDSDTIISFPPGGDKKVEFHLENRSVLYFRFDQKELVRRVDVTVGFRLDARIEVFAMMDEVPVAQTMARGNAGDVVSVTLEFDVINAVRIGSGPAALIDLCFVLVSDEATKGWEPVPGFPYPMHLPVFHPDYPCTLGVNEDIENARDLVRKRVLYGKPDKFVESTSTPGNGTVSVVNGSPIVTGSGTHWKEELAKDEEFTGSLLKVQGDSTAYTIMSVVSDSKLVLSRQYDGVSRSGVPYMTCKDKFGQLHDQLAYLVSGGPGTTKMAYRSMPVPAYDSGTVEIKRGDTTVKGTGTNWTPELVGLNFQIYVNEPVYTIKAVNSYTQLTLDRKYTGTPVVGSNYQIFAALMPTGSEEEAPRMPRQYPLNLVLLGALNPEMAQMVGLYWVDQTAKRHVAYDYLILADNTDYFKGDPRRIFSDLAEGIFPNLDGYIVFNKKLETPQPLDLPDDPRVYSLPGGFIYVPKEQKPKDKQKLIDAQNNAGLRWDLDMQAGAIVPGKSVMYHVWRTKRSEKEPANAPADNQYDPITKDKPLLITRPLDAGDPQRPPNWPPIPFHFIDRGLDEFAAHDSEYGLEDGWYSYKVSGIDIFGRHSPNSSPAQWYQWTPVSDPRPWYYKDPAGDRSIHSFAVHLLDKIPPPPPAGIEAHALDPADPMVLKDADYDNWRASLKPVDRDTLVGLRVSWLWTPAHERQAPDTREFRIYYQPEHMNAMVGHVVSVTNTGKTEREVGTDILDTYPTDAYVGAKLNIGPDSFSIIGSESVVNGAESRLRVLVKIPSVYTGGTVKVDGGSTTVKVTGSKVSKKQIGLTFKSGDQKTSYTILDVDPATRELTLDRGYKGPSVSGQSYTIAGKLPYADMPCNIVIPSHYSVGKIAASNSSTVVNGTNTAWSKELAGRTFQILGESAQYTIAKVDSETQLILNTPYQGPKRKDKAYVIIHLLSKDYTLPESWAKRICVVGYNEHVTETLRTALGANGHPLSGENATVAGKVVLLKEKKDIPDLSGITLEASSPFAAYIFLKNDTSRPSKLYRIVDIDNTAKKTVTVEGTPNIGTAASEWAIGLPVRRYEVFLPAPNDKNFNSSQAKPIVYANVGVSAADDKKHTKDNPKWNSGDWGDHHGNEGRVGGLATIARVHRIPPDPPVPPPDSDKVYASLPDYHGHAFYTYRWKPQKYLKTHIFRALDDALFKTDWFIRTTRTALNPIIPRHKHLFPTSWKFTRKQVAANQLNAIKSKTDYATLPPDAQKLLGLLPGNEGAKWNSGLQDRDWVIRMTRTKLTGSNKKYFPDDWNKPDTDPINPVNKLRREKVAKDLNKMVVLLSGKAATITNKIAMLDGTPDLTKVKPYRDTIWLASDKARADKLYRIIAVDNSAHTITIDGEDNEPKLSGASSAWALYLDEYQGLFNNAMRILAGLPGNERAFTQITIQPLDPKDPNNANRRGPDDPDDFIIDTPDKPLWSKSLRTYIDTLDGRSTNRYFFRSAYVDDVHNRSEELSLSSPPVYLADVMPPAKPRLHKVLGGERRVKLKWGAHREPNIRRYLIYRTDKKEDGRDIRLMGKPVANLPAVPLVVSGGEVDLGTGSDIVKAERVYAAEGFIPDADLISGQSAQQYLAAPIATTGTKITGLTAPNDTPVIVVYRDSNEGLQHTPWKNAPRVWIDQGLVGPRTYYYRVVASSEGETGSGKITVYSSPSDLAASRVFDLTPLEPPTWVRAEWVLVDVKGNEHTWGTIPPSGQTYTSAVALEWNSKELYSLWIVQRKLKDTELWRTVSSWLNANGCKGKFTDKSATSNTEYVYRIRGKDVADKVNTAFNEQTVPKAGTA